MQVPHVQLLSAGQQQVPLTAAGSRLQGLVTAARDWQSNAARPSWKVRFTSCSSLVGAGSRAARRGPCEKPGAPCLGALLPEGAVGRTAVEILPSWPVSLDVEADMPRQEPPEVLACRPGLSCSRQLQPPGLCKLCGCLLQPISQPNMLHLAAQLIECTSQQAKPCICCLQSNGRGTCKQEPALRTLQQVHMAHLQPPAWGCRLDVGVVQAAIVGKIPGRLRLLLLCRS